MRQPIKHSWLVTLIFFYSLTSIQASDIEASDIQELWGPAVKTIDSKLLDKQQVIRNRVYRVDSDPEQGFYWPYFFAVPDGFKPNHPILIIPNNDGQTGISSAQREYFASAFAEDRLFAMARKLGVAILVPSFPRPKLNNKNGNLYLHALTRPSLLASENKYKRVDLQLIAMRNHLQTILNKQELPSSSKLLLYGFSAAGDFVSRFTAIHPETVSAVVAGGMGGLPILPITHYNDRDLSYPVGTGDFATVTGHLFQGDKFKTVAMMFVQGDQDDNDSVVESKYIVNEQTFSSDSYNYHQAVWINKTFGDKPIDRLEQVISIYRNAGVKDFAYITMKGESHRDKYIKPNAVTFFNCVLSARSGCAGQVEKEMAEKNYSQ